MTRADKIAKLRKCLALSKSANEHEAAAALAAAARLMSDLGMNDGEAQFIDIDEDTARASRTMRPPKWESILAQTVSRAMQCAQIIDGHGDRCFVGRVPAPEIASYAFAVLFRQLKAARSAYIRVKLRRCGPGRKRARADAFCEGWAITVFAKVAEIAPKFDDDLVNRYLVERHPSLAKIGTRAAPMKRARDDFWNGAAAGSDVDLHRGMSGTAPGLLAHG